MISCLSKCSDYVDQEEDWSETENRIGPRTDSCGHPVFAKTAGLSDKTGKFSFCPAEKFSLSDKFPVISVKTR